LGLFSWYNIAILYPTATMEKPATHLAILYAPFGTQFPTSTSTDLLIGLSTSSKTETGDLVIHLISPGLNLFSLELPAPVLNWARKIAADYSMDCWETAATEPLARLLTEKEAQLVVNRLYSVEAIEAFLAGCRYLKVKKDGEERLNKLKQILKIAVPA
jgi:hypothetical protein